jgi:hypothetical protein
MEARAPAKLNYDKWFTLGFKARKQEPEPRFFLSKNIII